MRAVALAVILFVGVSCAASNDDGPEAGGVERCLDAAGYGDQHERDADFDYQRQQDSKFNDALVNCYREEGIELPPPGALTEAQDQVVLAEVKCLRDKGWDLPDPVRGDHGALSMGDITGVVPADQMDAFRADDEACVADIVPPEGIKVGD